MTIAMTSYAKGVLHATLLQLAEHPDGALTLEEGPVTHKTADSAPDWFILRSSDGIGLKVSFELDPPMPPDNFRVCKFCGMVIQTEEPVISDQTVWYASADQSYICVHRPIAHGDLAHVPEDKEA